MYTGPQVFSLHCGLKGDKAVLRHVFVVLNLYLFLQNTRKVEIGSAISSLHPSIVCHLRPSTIHTVPFEIKFSLCVALTITLLVRLLGVLGVDTVPWVKRA